MRDKYSNPSLNIQDTQKKVSYLSISPKSPTITSIQTDIKAEEIYGEAIRKQKELLKPEPSKLKKSGYLKTNKVIEWIKELCKCYNYCYITKNLEQTGEFEQEITNKADCIVIDVDIDEKNYNKFKNIKTDTINYMTENGYLKKIGSIYYIVDSFNVNHRLSWDNIKDLYYNKDYELHQLLWMFRKVMVDCILKTVIYQLKKKYNDDIKVYSVGSNTAESDYDITIYSKNDMFLSEVIKDFHNEFMSIFSEHSSIVFDTNVYGIAYIMYHMDESFKKSYITIDGESCDIINPNTKLNIHYLKHTEIPFQHTQVVWAFIKYLKNFREIFSGKIFKKYIEYLKTQNINNDFLNISTETFILLKNTQRDYSLLITKKNQINKSYTKYNQILFLNDYISFVNFYGSETYFSRGAFLDTVLNSQICKDIEKDNKVITKKNKIKLTEQDYIASILENAGFYFIHNDKPKYIKRVMNTFNLLCNDYKEYNISTAYISELNDSITDETFCTLKDFDIIENCKKFQSMNNMMKLITYILTKYFKETGKNFIKHDFPFHNIYIKYLSDL
jgi:hypothetical protein